MSDDLSLDARLLRFRSDPGAEACHDLSAALLDAQRAREALEVLSRGLALREDDSRLLRLASRAFLAEGDVLRAQQTLTRVIRMHPDDVEAYRLLAETLVQRGDVGRASAAVAKALSLSPRDPALLAMRRRLVGGGPEPESEAPAAPLPEVHVPAPAPAPEVAPEAVATEATAELETEREALVRDVQVMLGEAMKAASEPPPAMPIPDPDTRPSRRPLPSPGVLAARLPPRATPVSAASAAPEVASSRSVPPAEVPSAAPAAAAPAAPAAPAGPPAAGAPGARPGPRRSPTLMGFAPPRPPARPASVPPPARSAPLPAIRPPSVRPPSMTGPVAPPNFGPPAVTAPLPVTAPLLAPAPLSPASVPPPAPPPRAEEQEEDEPTSFMDRESLAGALGVPLPQRESRRPAAAEPRSPATPSASTPARPGPSAPLPDTLPEFVVPELGSAPAADAPKPSAVLLPRLDAEPEPASARGEEPGAGAVGGRRKSSSGRTGAVLLVAVLVTLGGGLFMHRAGLLPAEWSRQIEAHTGLEGGHAAPEAIPAPGTNATTESPETPEPAPEPAPEPVVDEHLVRVAALDAVLAEGRVPEGLPEDDEPESLRLRAEAALLYATPWWSASPSEDDRASLEGLVGQVTSAIERNPEVAVTLRATAIRLRAAQGATDALTDARALAAEQPSEPLVRWTLAEALLSAGELAEADAVLAGLIDSGPELMRARAAVQRAWLARKRDDHATASAAIAVARTLAPSWELVQLRALDLRLDAGEYRAVLAELAPTTEAAGEAGDETAGADESAERLLRELRAQLGLEQLEASEASWARLPEAVRQRADVQPVAAEYFLARSEPAEAVRALAPLAQVEPGDPALIALYATALYEAGQTLVASAQFERAIALDQGHPEALIGFAQVLLRARKYREARINLDRAEAGLRGRVRPPATLAHLRVMRARIMVEERELQQAAVLLRRTLEIEGAPSEGWFYLGEALSRSNSPESRAAYERYLSLSPVGPLASRARRAIQ